MTKYLYVLSVGPVQDFIASARRTRDLWFGSYLLSEISRAAAKAIADSGGELIFPALKKSDPELEPTNRGHELDSFNIGNVILAKLPERGGDPEEINEKAETAAKDIWLNYAEAAKKEAKGVIRDDPTGDILWKEQVEDLIEFNSAWVPLENEDDYRIARKRVIRLLAGRKSIRDFEQVKGVPGIPKCSLDGARESVLKEKRKNLGILELRMRLSDGEQLSAIGLTKRLAGGRKMAFPSVTRVALDPWVRRIVAEGGEAGELLDEIGSQCRGDNSFSSGTGNRHYSDFPYDGQVCYLPRLNEFKKDLTKIPEDQRKSSEFNDDLGNLLKIEGKLRKLKDLEIQGSKRKIGEPNPYFAILIADGDHMGRAIANIESSNEHYKFSEKLSAFAGKAREIVEKDYHGVMVYSGGDDVIAFLPVDTCLKAARALHDEFGKTVEGLTFSVGIAIGHKNDPLEDLLDYGRQAEKAAKKPDRNGLALHLHTRSGGEPLKIREQWKEPGNNSMDERLDEWTGMHKKDEIPDKAGHEMLQMTREYKEWGSPPPAELLEKDLSRLLKRKSAGHGTTEISGENIRKIMEGVDSAETLHRRAKEIIIASRIASAATGGDNL
ncbi:type III-B CRISPR-associated protein Cas10/Cmr2 [Methanolacinia paynteri]|uniref:type III-B CRISPR-associated protein Cas10/Cmr2 n=1 Tax=Methanolacinia paynteri TaxID=230356 RepID=UPI00064EA456|nr:type III-B CRISPR-associated protein Cas10/Cmr2 [Methanolacinia paynteri]